MTARRSLTDRLIQPSLTTIVGLPSGGLLVVSPPAVACGGLAGLDALGRVDEVVVPNSFRYVNVPAFLQRYPHATLRVPPAFAERVPKFPAGAPLGDEPVDAWRGVVEHAVLGPVRGLAEVRRCSTSTCTWSRASRATTRASPRRPG